MPAAVTLVLGTRNSGKSREFRLLCPAAWQVLDLSRFPHVLLPEETGGSFAANARRKASAAATQLTMWVLADDTGLEVDALSGEPGVHSARYAGPQATAEMNRQLLLERLQGVDLPDRGARFVCHLALADPSGQTRAESTGYCRGRIGFTVHGQGGFGYDSLFEMVEYHQTLAALGEAAASCLTHRARAWESMRPQLEQHLRGAGRDAG